MPGRGLQPGVDSAPAHYNLGVAAGILGDTDYARFHLSEAARVDPSNKDYRNALRDFDARGSVQEIP